MHQNRKKILGSTIELIHDKASPFTLILALYKADLALESFRWENINLLQQCILLQPNKINSKSSRKSVLNELMNDNNNEWSSSFDELRKKSYLRIRIKSVLSQFYKECISLHSMRNIREWSGHQLLITFIHHLISIASDPDQKGQKAAGHPKVWQFVEYMRKYFGEMEYKGNDFMSVFDDNKSKGFGLMMIRKICDKYDLKTGPYSKVKKQCNTWAANLYEESQRKISQKSIANKHKPKVSSSPNDKKKYVGTVAQIVDEQKKSKNDKDSDKNEDPYALHNNYSSSYVTDDGTKDELNGKWWYWLCDHQGLRWVPYRESDAVILNAGWRNRDKSVVIKSGTYRVEFNYENIKEPCGNQFNNTIANPSGRIIKCEIPKETIWGMKVQKNPI